MERSNWLLVNKFIDYLNEVERLNPKSLSRYRAYLTHLLYWAGKVPLHKIESINPSLERYLADQSSPKTNGPLSLETRRKVMGLTGRLLIWAKSVFPRDFGKISNHWIKSFKVPKTDPTAHYQEYVELEEMLLIKEYGQTNKGDLSLFRDVAGACFLYLSGIRASAFVSISLAAVNIRKREVIQDPARGVRTKNSKYSKVFLLEIPPLIEFISEWDYFIRRNLPPTACWFTPLKNEWGELSLSSADPGQNRGQLLNRRLRLLFSATGLVYKSSHKFRHGHAHWGISHATTIGEYKAVSQNLSHPNILITDQIYSGFSDNERRKIISGLSNNRDIRDS